MIFTDIINDIVVYLQSNIYVSIGLALVSLLLLFRKPKLFIMLVVIASFLLGILYIISGVSDTGTAYKQKMIKENVLKD